MPNRRYELGARFERECANILRDRGYICTRAAGSKSPYDLIASNDTEKPRFIQCKVISRKGDAKRMLDVFIEKTQLNPYLRRELVIKVKGLSGIYASVSMSADVDGSPQVYCKEPAVFDFTRGKDSCTSV